MLALGEPKRSEFRDGTPIQHLQGTTEWLTTDAAGWCYPEDAQGNALAELGRLYNFWVVGNNICPSGWRIPSFGEWFEGDNLKPWFEAQAPEYVGMTGAALKVPGTGCGTLPTPGPTTNWVSMASPPEAETSTVNSPNPEGSRRTTSTTRLAVVKPTTPYCLPARRTSTASRPGGVTHPKPGIREPPSAA